MKMVQDYENGGIALTADSLEDAVEYGSQAEGTDTKYRYSEFYPNPRNGYWLGRTFKNWTDVREQATKPWETGLERIQEMADELRGAEVKPPESLKRRFKWSEYDGEPDVDRYLSNQPEFMRDCHRTNVKTVNKSVTLLLNVGGNSSKSADSMFWRGAAASVVTDMLEEAGYACEIWVWSLTNNAAKYGLRNAFWCCRLKGDEDPINMDSLAVGVSGWFFRIVNLACQIRAIGPNKWTSNLGYQYAHIGNWMKHIEIGTGEAIEFPVTFNQYGAIEAAKKILETVAGNGQEKP